MTTITGGNEVFRPTPIRFEKDYDVTKMRRLALDVTNLANRLAALTTATGGSTLPSSAGKPAGDVLTILAAGGIGWAPPTVPSSFPWSAITGIPATFPPTVHQIASTTGLGPAHTIAATAPGQVLKATGTSTALFAALNYAELGDVNTTGLQGGYVPQWNSAAGQWQMVPLTTSGGINPGVSQWGINPIPLMPNKPFAGTAQYAQLNIPLLPDTLLGGDGNWHPLTDIEISFAQISDVPPLPPRPTGNTAQFLRADFSWAQVTGTAGPPGPQGPPGPIVWERFFAVMGA